MVSPSGLVQAPVVAHVLRNDVVESVHHGLGVITAPDGSVVHALGDPATPVFARSSNKPLQALAMVRAGLDVSGSHLALVCASHSGEPMHLAGVRELLATSGFAETDLDNTPDLPWDQHAREAWLAAGRGRAAIAQNCSGKHAGMLATCAAARWDAATYRSPRHPLQRTITQLIAELYDHDVLATGVDGCGAPAHQLPLRGLARAFGILAGARDGAEQRVADAMRSHPELVGGTGREVTDLMRAIPGVIAKDGAEGVFAAGTPDGHGVAVKIVDGNPRASRVVLAALLARLPGFDPGPLARLADSRVLGHGRPVGRVVAVAN